MNSNNLSMAELVAKKAQIQSKMNQMETELKSVDEKIGAIKFGAKIGDRFTIPATNNTYVVHSYDEENIFIQMVKVRNGVETLGMVTEARFWFEYKAGKVKTPTRRN